MIKMLFLTAATSFVNPTFADTKLDKLGEAIGRGDRKMFEEALSRVGDVEQSLNPQRETPLTLAAYNDRAEWVLKLLELGAKVDHQTTTGYTALMFAAMAMVDPAAATETVRVLLAHGADRRLKTHGGKTALDLALEHKQPKIVDLLREPLKVNDRPRETRAPSRSETAPFR